MATLNYQSVGQQAIATSASVVYASDSLSHLSQLRRHAPRLPASGTFATSGDNTAIPAGAAGTRIVVCSYRIQNHTATAQTVLMKHGSGDAETRPLRCGDDSSGDSRVYSPDTEMRLPADTALVLNLSAADTVGYYFEYFLENATTGLPSESRP